MEDNKQVQSLLNTISNLYESISKLPSLQPSTQVNKLFTELVLACIPPISIDVSKLSTQQQQMRSNLIALCGEAEGLLESHYSDLLSTSYEHPLDHLDIFPYYSNYINLTQLEYKLVSNYVPKPPQMVAFIGSGPLPLSSIVLAVQHMHTAELHNYDINPLANARAEKLLRGHEELGNRMKFHTMNVMDVTSALEAYDVVFLAALVGMSKDDKVRIIEHLGRYMAAGAVLVVRSAHGARAFLYPVVETEDMKGCFEMLTVYHPSDEVINSVVVARKAHAGVGNGGIGVGGTGGGMVRMPCKCCEIVQGLKHLGHGGMIMEEVNALEELPYS